MWYPLMVDTGLMETPRREVVQRPLCRKGCVVPLHNMGLTYCFASYSCNELDRRKLFSVSGHCHCATAMRGQRVSGSAITTCRRFDCVFGDGVGISKYFPRCCGEKSPARGSGFRVRLRTLDFYETQHTPLLSVQCCRVSTVTRYNKALCV
jgi:hypothetical protein